MVLIRNKKFVKGARSRFTDALVAVPAALHAGAPVLLTDGQSIHPSRCVPPCFEQMEATVDDVALATHLEDLDSWMGGSRRVEPLGLVVETGN